MMKPLSAITAILLILATWALAAQQAGTTYGTRFRFEATGCTVYSASGTPEGTRTGNVCDVYVRADASPSNPALYVKTGGTGTATGWVAVLSTGTGAPLDAPIFTTSATVGAIATQDVIKFQPNTSATRFAGIFTLADLTTADKTYTFPDASVSFPAPVDGYLLASSATGYKTVRDFLVLYQGAARCQGPSAVSFWNLPNAATAASPTCLAGTNLIRATLDYSDGSNHTAQIPFYLPDDIDLTGDVRLELYWSTSATSGDVKFQVATACVGPDEDPDPAFNAAQTMTDAALANADHKNVGALSALTVTGCAAGEVLFVKLDRDGTTSGDTIGATARVIATELKYYRKW